MKTIIISLGGSLIVPKKIDTNFLKKFKKTIINFTNKYKFLIICGGGKLARDFQERGRKLKLTNKALDWLGIYATRINAQILRVIFNYFTEEKIIIDPTKKIISKKKIILCAGWKPGWSTDYDAILLAKNSKSKIIINMTNVSYIYNKDPKKHKDAKPIKNINWENYKKLVSKEWKPGLNLPFDPIAAKEAKESKLSVIIIGKNLNNLKKLLKGEKFKGTIVG